MACHLHQPGAFNCDSPVFHSEPRRTLGKEGSQGKDVPAICILKQPGFEGEIDQEENLCPNRLALTEE